MSVCVAAQGPSRGAVPVHRADTRIQPLERFEHPADAAELVLNRDQVDLVAVYVGDCSQRPSRWPDRAHRRARSKL